MCRPFFERKIYMNKILMYDTRKCSDMMLCLRDLINDIMLIDDPYVIDDSSGVLRAVNLRLLKCYEKHDQNYIFDFIDKKVNYSSKYGKSLLGDKVPYGFFQINRSDVVNKSYVREVNDKGLYLYNESLARPIGEKYMPNVLRMLGINDVK